MRVFLTGATGFVGSHLVPELIAAGHRVAGLARSDASAGALARAGADVVQGDLDSLAVLRATAEASDAVIHAAFDHDPRAQKASAERDRRVIAALGEALAGSDRPLIVTSGTGLVRRDGDTPASEADEPVGAAEVPRAGTEEAAKALAEAGLRVMTMRLPQVHDTRRQGRISWQVELAREQGRVAYVGDGANRAAAVHVSDAVRLYRLALERGEAGARYHAVAEEGVAMREIATAIGTALGLPVVAIASSEADDAFGWMAPLVTADMAASSVATRRKLGWEPTGPSLLQDLLRLER